MAGYSERSARLYREVDANRIDFLKTDLATCFTIVRIAETEYKTGSRELAERSIGDAEKGYRSLHRLLNDPKHSRHIREEIFRDLTAELARLGQEIQKIKQRYSA